LSPELASAAVEAAPELPYSVLIASYAARADANERLARLSGEAGGIFFVAPTPVRGAVYHRVFAGAFPSRTRASEHMQALVERGWKDEASAWHLRPARLAFRLGVFPSRAEAEGRAPRAARDGISTYILSVPLPAAANGGTRPDSLFVVYAGAYESESAANPMAALLAEAGQEAELEARRGTGGPSKDGR
ncbi:MAG: SPOR domain-containing protein, partial [Gemmatimonadota bacterium]